jgi:DNA recombination protein RmuC
MATLTTIQVILRNVERDKHAKEIQVELAKLAAEFARYRERWDKLSRSISTVNTDVNNINVTTKKITDRFESIQKVDLSSLEIETLDEIE